MSLIFIEIIQLNFCGLSTMTKKNIEERASLDSIISNDNNNNVEDISNINGIDIQKINFEDYIFELKEINNYESNQILS